MRYRVSANLCWDIESGDSKLAEEKAMEQLLKMAKEAGIKLRKPKVSLNKLKELGTSTVLAEFQPDEILKIITTDGNRREFVVDGKTYRVKMNSQRYFSFAENKKCVSCGIEGKKMLLELPTGCEYPHFNLYAEEHGEKVLMTKDHKIPVARGGKDVMENYQTMCAVCNNIKGKDILHLDDLKVLRGLYNKATSEHVSSSQIHQMLQEEKVRLMTNRASVMEPAPAPAIAVSGSKLMPFSPTSGTYRLALLTVIASVTIGVAVYSWPCAALGLVLAILGYLAGSLK